MTPSEAQSLLDTHEWSERKRLFAAFNALRSLNGEEKKLVLKCVMEDSPVRIEGHLRKYRAALAANYGARINDERADVS